MVWWMEFNSAKSWNSPRSNKKKVNNFGVDVHRSNRPFISSFSIIRFIAAACDADDAEKLCKKQRGARRLLSAVAKLNSQPKWKSNVQSFTLTRNWWRNRKKRMIHMNYTKLVYVSFFWCISLFTKVQRCFLLFIVKIAASNNKPSLPHNKVKREDVDEIKLFP